MNDTEFESVQDFDGVALNDNFKNSYYNNLAQNSFLLNQPLFNSNSSNSANSINKYQFIKNMSSSPINCSIRQNLIIKHHLINTRQII